MSSQNKNKQPKNLPSSQDVLSKFMDVQSMEATNKAEELKLEKERIQFQREKMKLQASIATKSIDAQREIYLNQIPEERKKVKVHYIYSTIVVVIILGFSAYCLHIGKEDFVYKIFSGLVLIATHYITYRFGKSAGGDGKPLEQVPTIEDADVIKE